MIMMTLLTAMMIASRTVAAAPRLADIMDINGHMAGPALHNRLITGGLVIYTAFISGSILFLGKRRLAGLLVAILGGAVGIVLLVRWI
jgi:hypothetical protein